MKKAYRQLSLIYHPDKNPDPAAATYFAESITKAYKALTGAQQLPMLACKESFLVHAQTSSLLPCPWRISYPHR